VLRDTDVVPSDEWQQLYDSEGKVVYFQETTGRYNRYSDIEAALMVQRAFRRRLCMVGGFQRGMFHGLLLSFLWIGPQIFKMDIGTAAKALQFFAKTRRNFVIHPHKLSSMLNMALLFHTVDIDFEEARFVLCSQKA